MPVYKIVYNVIPQMKSNYFNLCGCRYYSLDNYYRHKMEKEIKRGFKKATPTERIVFNDEEQKRYVLLLFHCKTSFSNLQFQYIHIVFVGIANVSITHLYCGFHILSSNFILYYRTINNSRSCTYLIIGWCYRHTLLISGRLD